METAARLARFADKVLSLTVGLLLMLVLLYGGYALWDVYTVFNSAAADSELLSYKPALLANEDGSNPTLNELAAVNPDVVAWLSVDDTNIDYPVLQGKDNIKYLNTNVYGEFALSGSLFLDYQCAPDFTDFYSLIYGHHMEGNVMFGELTGFLKKDYFDSHGTGTLYLADKTYQIEFFAALSVDAYDRYVFSPGANETGDREALLSHIKETASRYREIGVDANDRIIGLTTCADATTNGRTAVYGRITEMTFTQQGGDNN